MKLEFSGLDFETYANINFHGRLSSGSRVVQREQLASQPANQPDRQTNRRGDLTKLIVVFRNFANAPNKKKLLNFQLNVTLFQVL